MRTHRLASALALALLALVALVVSAGPAAAGGWAVSSLDAVPDPVAGEDVEVGFTVLQHGRTPAVVDGTGITIRDAAGAETTFPARADGPTGHYVAVVRFPSEGSFTWQVDQGWFAPHDLGAIDVRAPGGSPSPSAEPASEPASTLVTVRPETAQLPLAVRLLLPVLAIGAAALAVSSLVATRRRPTLPA